MDFRPVHNTHEQTVFAAVVAAAPRFAGAGWANSRGADSAELPHADFLADVACVALNRLPPRYARPGAVAAPLITEKERLAWQREIDETVNFAYGYVQAEQVKKARLHRRSPADAPP